MGFHNEPETNSVELYCILNVSKQASFVDIQRSYKRLSRVFHPDKSTDKQNAELYFVAIKSSHDVLIDPVLRLAYDYGGSQAVVLVKRSQASAQAQRVIDNEADDANELDLYSALKEAKDEEEAALLIKEALEEFRMHRENISRPQFEGTIGMPWSYLTSQGIMQRESASLHFQTRHQIRDYTFFVGAASQLQRTAETSINGTIGVDYQPHRGTHVAAEGMIHHRRPPQLSLRTSRQTSSGNFIMVALSGRTKSVKNWVLSFISYRHILWGISSDSSAEPTKVQATWRLGLKPTGELQHAMASLKNFEWPQWKVRLGLGSYPLKVSYQLAESDAPYVAFSQGWMWSRLKILWISTLDGKWMLRYGLKYDGRAIYTGGSAWTLLVHLQSNQWDMRLPISLFEDVSYPVATMVSVLLSQLFDKQLEEWKRIAGLSTSTMYDSSSYTDSYSLFAPFSTTISNIASKKRQIEDEVGLVILRATWEIDTNSDKRDATDLVQFWVCGGQVSLPAQELTLWRITSNHGENTLTWNWRTLFGLTISRERMISTQQERRTLYVRYKFERRVYEIRFNQDEVVLLPNERATDLGAASHVQ